MRRHLLAGLLLLAVSCGRAVSTTTGSDQLFATQPRGFDALIRRGTLPTVVTVWASWCIPCKSEAPILKAASERYAGRVRFLGLDSRDTRQEAEAFIRRYGWTYPSGFDPSGSVMADLKVLGLPTTFFYRPGGDLALVHSGEIHQDQLEDKIGTLLRSSPR
jgi:cytochrome c biogenesis protein CcmG/thiol:disulfide interchange protein DsbE